MSKILLMLMCSVALIVVCFTVKGSMEFNETTVLDLNRAVYSFNSTMMFDSVQVSRNTLWLNNTPFYANGTGNIYIKFYRVVSANDFNFTFNSTESKDLVEFKVGDQQFYREYLGTNVTVSIEPQSEVDNVPQLIDDMFKDTPFGNLLNILFITIPVVFILWFVFSLRGGRGYI